MFQIAPFLQRPGDQPFSIENQFSDFFSQLPTGLFVMVCGSSILLLAAFAWFIYFKPLYKARKNRQENPTPQVDESMEIPAMKRKPKKNDFDDLPDLDMLLDPSSLAKELPPIDDTPEAAPKKPAPMRYQRGNVRVKMDNGATIPAEEVLSVLRDPRDGRLIVQINNTGYRSLVDAPNTKETFIKIMRELSDVVNKPDNNPPDPAESLPDTPATKSAPPPPISLDGAMPGDLPKYRIEDSIKPTSRGKYEAAPVPELNIANAIEAYLQHKLKHTPEYSGRVLHVLPAPGGGVRIQVDDIYYEAVSDIEDPEVRAFLQQTIQEWQARQ
ncbi:MAG: hypothetical protein CUN56_05570 [Phototrophicales bacterium]|nr:MAG: hypothetical protein CUN56_05570 [Phototrophicales bacterium]